jgi:putrescine importer
MTKAYPQAGSVYTYASKSFNPYVGFLSGWTIVLGYMFLPMLNYLCSAIFLKAAFPEIPFWLWVVLFVIIVTGANYFGIQIADIFNKAVIWLQIIFLVGLAFILIRYILNGGGVGTLLDFNSFFNATEFSKEGIGLPALAAGASIVCLAFLGFDGIATLSEESINPTKNIPRAIMISCIGAGSLFIIFTYFLQLAWPTAWFELNDKDGMAYHIITTLAGSFMGYFFVAGYVVGCIAASVSAVASASRVLYGMGRDGLLPKKCFGYIHPKYKTPIFNIIIMGLFGFTALFFSLSIAASLINFGALLGFAVVNATVIMHYFIKMKDRNVIKHLLIPAIGAVYTLIMLVSLNGTSLIFGVIWEVIGFVYLFLTTNGFRKLPAEITEI